MYWLDADGTRRLAGGCGSPPGEDPCTLQASPTSGGNRTFSDPSYGDYEICEGLSIECGSTRITWPAWPVDLSVSAITTADGQFRVKVANGSAGFPEHASVELYDENRRAPVNGAYFDFSNGTWLWPLTGCAGPYFRATMSTGNEFSGNEDSRQTGLVRVNGISNDGEPCHDDPPGGGGGGGNGGGGGDGEPPAAPTAIIDGPTSVSVVDPAELTVRPSTPTDYPYHLYVRDTSNNNEIVGSCQTSKAEGCKFTLRGDVAVKESYTQRLVAETHLGGDVVSTGDERDQTWIPYRTVAKIQLESVRPADEGVASAGVVSLRIGNVDERQAYGYDVRLYVKDLQATRPRWEYVTHCPGGEEAMDCTVEYVAPPHSSDSPLELQFKSVVTYIGEVRDQKVLNPPVAVLYGTDWNKLQTAGLAAEANICALILTRHPGPPLPGTSYPASVAACQAGLVTLAIWYFLRDTDPAELGEAIAALWHEIRNATAQVTFPTPGGGGGTTTTSGSQLYDDEITAIAKALRKLNQGVSELTLTTAKAVAAACVATSAYQGMSAMVGVALGPGFCRKPSMPIFIVGADVNEAAQHDFDAIFGHAGKAMAPHPAWAVLNYASRKDKIAAQQPLRWYRNDVACKDKTGIELGLDCDEYPYFSTEQGGKPAVPKPSLRPIDSDENQKEGRLLSRKLIQRCSLDTATGITKTSNGSGGSPYLVLPMPISGLSDVPSILWKPIASHAPLTFGICNRSTGGGGGVSDS